MKVIVDLIKEKNIEKLKMIIDKNQYQKQLYTANASDFILSNILEDNIYEEELVFLCKQDFFKPEVSSHKYFIKSCEKGYLNYVKIFLEQPSIRVDHEFNMALRIAVKNNQVEIVKYLLKNKKVNPRAKNDEAVIKAAQNNNKEIINLLLEHDLNLVSKDNRFIRNIIFNNELELLKKVFNNKNYQSKSTYIAAWEEAAAKKNKEIINYLIERNDYNLIDKAHDLIKRLVKEGNLEYLKLLINKMNVEEKQKNLYFALRESCKHKQLDIFKYIVEEEKINPLTSRSKNIMIVIENNCFEIFNEILKYKDSNKNFQKNLFYIIKIAMKTARTQHLNILLKEPNAIKYANDIIEKDKYISKEVKIFIKFNTF